MPRVLGCRADGISSSIICHGCDWLYLLHQMSSVSHQMHWQLLIILTESWHLVYGLTQERTQTANAKNQPLKTSINLTVPHILLQNPCQHIHQQQQNLFLSGLIISLSLLCANTTVSIYKTIIRPEVF